MQADAQDADQGLHVAGGVTGYRRRTFDLLRCTIAATGAVANAIDVGAGDGWMAKTLMDEGLIGRCIPVDVVRRRQVVVEPVLYDGARMPMENASVDLVYAVDAVHHTADPFALLAEMARVSRRFIALKDHTYSTRAGAWMLRLLDEVGNRRFSIGSPGHYQRRFEWLEALRSQGFVVRTLIHPARCHAGALGALTNGLQFVALLERVHGD